MIYINNDNKSTIELIEDSFKFSDFINNKLIKLTKAIKIKPREFFKLNTKLLVKLDKVSDVLVIRDYNKDKKSINDFKYIIITNHYRTSKENEPLEFFILNNTDEELTIPKDTIIAQINCLSQSAYVNNKYENNIYSVPNVDVYSDIYKVSESSLTDENNEINISLKLTRNED